MLFLIVRGSQFGECLFDDTFGQGIRQKNGFCVGTFRWIVEGVHRYPSPSERANKGGHFSGLLGVVGHKGFDAGFFEGGFDLVGL